MPCHDERSADPVATVREVQRQCNPKLQRFPKSMAGPLQTTHIDLNRCRAVCCLGLHRYVAYMFAVSEPAMPTPVAVGKHSSLPSRIKMDSCEFWWRCSGSVEPLPPGKITAFKKLASVLVARDDGCELAPEQATFALARLKEIGAFFAG